jgi:hypothetical protein
VGSPACGGPRPNLPLRGPQASPAPGWLPPELKPRTQRPWKVWMCQPPPAGLGPSTSGLSEQIWTVLKWLRKSCSSILHRTQSPPRAQDPRSRPTTKPQFLKNCQVRSHPQKPLPLPVMQRFPSPQARCAIAKIHRLPQISPNYCLQKTSKGASAGGSRL